MNQTTISVRTERRVKNRARRTAARCGISLGAALQAYLHELAAAEHATNLPRISATLERLLDPIERDISRRRNLSKPIRSAADLDAHLASL